MKSFSHLIFGLIVSAYMVGCQTDISCLADILTREMTIEMHTSFSKSKIVRNPFLAMSDEQISEFIFGFTLDYNTYAPNIVFSTEDFNINYTSKHLVVNFKDQNSEKWIQISRVKGEIDRVVLQKIATSCMVGDDFCQEIQSVMNEQGQ